MRTNPIFDKPVSSFVFAIILHLFLAAGISVPLAAQTGRDPDLAVDKIASNPVQPEPGARVELVATISNKGQGRITTGFLVFFEMDGAFLASRQISGRLERGRQLEVKLLWTAVEGDHLLRVEVDPFDEILESSESNNKLTSRVEVRKLQGIRSITRSLLESIGQGLQKTGQAFQIQPNQDLLQLLGAFQAALANARDELLASAERLSTLQQILSPNLSTEAQIQASDQIAGLYRSWADALGKAIEGLQKLNPNILLAAFGQVRAVLVGLSALAVEGISLVSLADAVPLMDQGLGKIEQLLAALNGVKGIDVNAVVRDLLALLTQMGRLLVQEGDDVLQAAQERAAQFTDGGGQPIVRYQAGQELKISAAGAQKLKLEVFDASGRAVFTGETMGERLNWNGIGGDGQALSPGRYYYRLTITDPSGSFHVELGEIVLSP